MKNKDWLAGKIITKKEFYFVISALIIANITNNYTKDKFIDGYQFFLAFFTILPLYILIIRFFNFALLDIKRNPTQLNNSLKYVVYAMILIFGSAPFLYLWGMRDVISNLKWQKHKFKINLKNEPNLFGSFLFILYLCSIIKKPLMAANRESRTPRW